MIGKNPATVKFFKVLLPGFETKMWLPPAFCTKASGHFSAEAVVTTCLGPWKIEVGKCSSGRFFFQGNFWDRFVEGHELRVGDFIMFEHIGTMHFNASIFDPSACEKEFPVNFKKDPADIDLQNPDETPFQHGINSTQHCCRIPPFKKNISASSGCDYYCYRSRRSCLYIPWKIWKPNDLHKKEKAILKIPGCSRREWPVKLTFYKDRGSQGGYDRLAMTKGWSEFCSSNNIKKGDECTFEIMDTTFGHPNDNVVIINVTIISNNLRDST